MTPVERDFVAELLAVHPAPWHLAMSGGSDVDTNPDYFDESDIEDANGRTVAVGVCDETAGPLVRFINAVAQAAPSP